MKLLFISQYFHPERFLNGPIALELVRRGHEVTAVCCVPNYPEGSFFPGYSNTRRRREFWHGVRIRRSLTIPRGHTPIQLIANYLSYPFAAFWEILKDRQFRPDVSFVSMPSPLLQAIAGIWIKRIFGVPTVLWVQDIWPDSVILTLGMRSKLATSLLTVVCGWIYRSADVVLIQNEAFRREILKFGANDAQISVLPNFAPESFCPLATAEIDPTVRSLIPDDKFVVMFAGNVGESQDFDTLIAAAQQLRSRSDIMWIVVGDGRDRKRIMQKAATLDLPNVRFLGSFPQDLMPSFFACADVMLVSLRDEPIFRLTIPSKLQCYMASAKPILCSVGGVAGDIVRASGGGVAVDPGDPQGLADAVVSMSKLERSELECLGTRSQAYYQAHYSSERFYDTLESILTETMRR